VATTKLPKPHELSQPWIMAASSFESLIFKEPKVLKSLCFAAVLSGQWTRIFEGNPSIGGQVRKTEVQVNVHLCMREKFPYPGNRVCKSPGIADQQAYRTVRKEC